VLCGDRVLPPGSEWLGRCVDLAKAYKQMAVPRDQRHLVVLCHHDEDGSPLYYISESLPFGAEGSVYGFVRTSRALSFLINEAILVPSSVYFDDFPALSPRALAKSATDSISFLGVEVKNKPNRVGHITDLLDELGSGRGDYKLIPVIQGQLNFASNFVLGRAISPLVSWHSPDSPILIFTDAAFEKGRATLGAVVMDTLGGPADIYDGELPSKLVSSWQRYADEQIICQAELAAAVSIRYRLRRRLAGRKCIYFIDNESARFSLIRAAGVPSMQVLASLFHVWDEDHPHYAWVERVCFVGKG
ncbi:kptA, partial [Symbiodinium sp. KB8]